MSIYQGGIPNQGFNGTFPKSEGSGPSFKPDPTAGAVDTTAGGPATFSGSASTGTFINTPSYDGPGDMEPGAMKVRNLDDIQNSV